jgi:hypothetical protein
MISDADSDRGSDIPKYCTPDVDAVAKQLAEAAVSVGERAWGAFLRVGDATSTIFDAMETFFASIVRFPLTWIQRLPSKTTVQVTISTMPYIRACEVLVIEMVLKLVQLL